jgi:hypothetical protein
MSGVNPNVPWFEVISPEEAQQWLREDPQAVERYVNEMWGWYNQIEKTLPAGYPHPMAYRDGDQDDQYLQDVRAVKFQESMANSMRNAVDGAIKANRPAPQASFDPDFEGLASDNPEDRKMAHQRIQDRNLIEDQTIKAGLAGDDAVAREHLDRARFFRRFLDRERKTNEYSYEKQYIQFLENDAHKTLEQASHWSEEQLQAVMPRLRQLMAAVNKESTAEYSWLLDRRSPYSGQFGSNPPEEVPMKLRKVHHAGLQAKEVFQSAADSDREIVDYLAGSGLTAEREATESEEAEPETEVTQTHSLENMTQEQFEEQRMAEGASRF